MLPPGPPRHVFLHTVEFMLRPERFLRRLRARYGDVFHVETSKLDAVFVCTPALAKEVFAHDPDDYDGFEAVLGDMLGKTSLPLTFGAKHRGQRKLLNPRLHGGQVKRSLDAMKEIAVRHLAGWDDVAKGGSVVRMIDVAQAMSLDVMVRVVFGADDDRERARSVLNDMLDGFSPLLLYTPRTRTRAFPPWRRFVARRAAFDAFVADLLAARRRGDGSGDDMVTMLLDVRDESGAPLDDSEIRDLLLILLIAGHETTAIAIAWGVYWLLREPRVLARLRDELDAFGPDPSAEALARAPYLGAVCSETLRMRPIFTDAVRPLLRPLEIGGYRIPAGKAVVVALPSILSDPELYPEPETFRPERFLERKFASYEFVAFGGGHRRCLGAALAEHQLRVILGTIAARWDLALADARPEEARRRHVTMAPARGVRVRVLGERRAAPKREASAGVELRA